MRLLHAKKLIFNVILIFTYWTHISMWDLHLQKIIVGDSCKLAYVSKWKLILNMNFLFCIFLGLASSTCLEWWWWWSLNFYYTNRVWRRNWSEPNIISKWIVQEQTNTLWKPKVLRRNVRTWRLRIYEWQLQSNAQRNRIKGLPFDSKRLRKPSRKRRGRGDFFDPLEPKLHFKAITKKTMKKDEKNIPKC